MRQFLRIFPLLLFLPAITTAQSPIVTTPIDSGRDVRVTTNTGRLSGRLLSSYTSADTLLRLCRMPWDPCGLSGDSTGAHTVRSADLLRLEVQRGNRAGHGALIGAGVGAGLGVLTFLSVDSWCSECTTHSSDLPKAVLGSAGMGALIGAALGLFFPGWGPAP